MTKAKGASWAQQKAKHVNTVIPVRLALAGDLWAEHARLETALAEAVERDAAAQPRSAAETDEAPQIAQQIRDLEERMRASEVEFVFRGIGRGPMARMLAAHPPTKDQTAQPGGEALVYNPETFPPALLAESCTRPTELAGNVTEWTEIHDTWSDGQVALLWNACQHANARVAETPFSAAASEVLRRPSSEPN